jgi:hypothetical protein
MHSANEDILSAVVVVVSDGNPNVESSSRKTGVGGDIREVTVAIVLEKPVGVLLRGFLQGQNVGSIGEENVQVSVVMYRKTSP